MTAEDTTFKTKKEKKSSSSNKKKDITGDVSKDSPKKKKTKKKDQQQEEDGENHLADHLHHDAASTEGGAGGRATTVNSPSKKSKKKVSKSIGSSKDTTDGDEMSGVDTHGKKVKKKKKKEGSSLLVDGKKKKSVKKKKIKEETEGDEDLLKGVEASARTAASVDTVETTHTEESSSSRGEGEDDHEDEDDDVKEEEIDVEDADGIRPIPPPNNPPMDKIRLIIKQPNNGEIRWPAVDPANTNIRMVRDFIEREYYKGHKIPRSEQRQLLYKFKPIFDTNSSGDYNTDDAKTLADYGITQDMSRIHLSYMHVNVVDPSTRQSMMINNVDPMNDIVFEFRKLAQADGYNLDKLRILHKENNNAEILKRHDQMTFFNCGIKHLHTLILEWPKITLRIKLPCDNDEDEEDNMDANGEDEEGNNGTEIIVDEGTGQKFRILKYTTQAEIDPLQMLHDYIVKETKIPQSYHKLLYFKQPTKNNTKKSPKPKPLTDPEKLLADYKVEDNDTIEFAPMILKLNLVNGGNASSTANALVYPNGTIGSIKESIEQGKFATTKKNDGDEQDGSVIAGIPAIPKTNLSLSKDNQELKRDSQQLFKAGIQDGDTLDVEKTKITIKVKLPESKSGKGGSILEFGVNPKVDDIQAIKNMIADKMSIPAERVPPLRYNGESVCEDPDGNDISEKQISEYNIQENDTIEMEPIKLRIHVVGTFQSVAVDGIDPFNDTIEDLKERIGPNGLNLLPIEKQRLRHSNKNLDEPQDSNSSGDTSPTIFDCDLKNLDTVDLEKSKIDISIRQPNGDRLSLEGVDPRKDSLEAIEEFLSREYYRGKDKDGTVPEDQLRPLNFEGGGRLPTYSPDSKTISLREAGMYDDGITIDMEPMEVHVICGSGTNATSHVLDEIDPMNTNIFDAKGLWTSEDDTPPENLSLFHKESDMKEVDDNPELISFYDHGIKDEDTLVVKRKPIVLTIKGPKDIGGGRTAKTLTIKAFPDEDDFDSIRQKIQDHFGYPVSVQKLNKITTNTEDPSRTRLEAPGDEKLSSSELNLVEDCTIELEPMTINIQSAGGGDPITIQVAPNDTILDVKQKLSKGKIKIPANQQRFLDEDGTEIGGDKGNENTKGSDDTTLADLGVADGDTFTVEKGKIPIRVKLPYGLKDIKVVIDPKNGYVDDIRQQIFEATGLAKENQQRIRYNNDLLDKGYSFIDNKDDTSHEKQCLAELGLKENCLVTVDGAQVIIKRMPEKKEVLLENVNIMSNRLQDLKIRIAGEFNVAVFKQRLLNFETEEEYVGSKDSIETLQEYGIQDGDVIRMELSKVNLTISLPDRKKIELTVDPRKDDVQTVRDFVMKKYYKNRNVPKEDLRPIMRGLRRDLNKEPGDLKLIELGIIKAEEQVTMKPYNIQIITPKRIIFCPNADPFGDTLTVIEKFVKYEGINVDGCSILFKENKMTDFKTVLYDLHIRDEDTIEFVKE